MRVLVTGAAERYGRPTVTALRAADHDPVAFVRDPNGPDARSLAERGVPVAGGRRDQLDHVEDALTEAAADALFVSTGAPTAREATEQGRTLVRAADRAGVPVVHASVLGADAEPGVPRVDVRASIDADLRERGVPHVSLRPGIPLDAFERARESVADQGRLPFPLDGRALAAFTDPHDVGRAAAAVLDARAFDDPPLPVSSGSHSLYDLAGVLSDVLDRTVEADPRGPTAAPRRLTAFYRWVNEGALLDDGEALASRHGVAPADLTAYFERAGWSDSSPT